MPSRALGTQVVWVEAGVAVGLIIAAVFLLLSLGKLIKREKLLPLNLNAGRRRD